MRSLLLALLLLSASLPSLAEDQREIAIRHLERKRTGGLSISNLKNIATAISMFETDHSGKLPASLQELTPEYLRTVPTHPADRRQAYIYQKTGPDSYIVSTPGDAFKDPGVPQGYPRYQGKIERMPDISKIPSSQRVAYLEKWANESRNGTEPVYWKPGKLLSRRVDNRQYEQLQEKGNQALIAGGLSGGYGPVLPLYKQMLQIGASYPWEEAEMRRFLKEMGAGK